MIRLAVRVRREHAELVLAQLLELAPAGVEEAGDDDSVEYAVYGAPGELPSLPALQAAAGDALVQVATREVPDDWGERWKAFHKAVVVHPPAGDGSGAAAVPALLVRPPWELGRDERRGARASLAGQTSRDGGGDVREIVIDPGQAFGTGAHATTRQCLELLLALAERDRSRGALIDVGTGSGVLAIAAAQLGYAPVVAIDNERESVIAAAANATANGVRVDVRRGDLRDPSALQCALPAAARDGRPVVTANLLSPLLGQLARALPWAPAHLIAGGMLPEELAAVTDQFATRLGLCERHRIRECGWGAVWLSADWQRPARG